MRVSLVGTVHSESGQASVGALQDILERSEPEVIFAEIPASHADRYKDGSHGTLESIATARFLESHQVDIVPVDLAKPEQKFFNDAEDMFRAVNRTSSDYRRLVDRNSAEVQSGGFPYPNSGRCIQAWADIYREVLATIDWTDDRRLREICDLWSRTNESRDREMMQNIELYSARNGVARGVFLVGAAHRGSIIGKALAGNGAGLPRIEWDLGDFLG